MENCFVNCKEQRSPLSQRKPVKPGRHKHCMGVLHVPRTQPGNLWHSVQVSPVHPMRHLNERNSHQFDINLCTYRSGNVPKKLFLPHIHSVCRSIHEQHCSLCDKLLSRKRKNAEKKCHENEKLKKVSLHLSKLTVLTENPTPAFLAQTLESLSTSASSMLTARQCNALIAIGAREAKLAATLARPRAIALLWITVAFAQRHIAQVALPAG